MLRRTNSQYPWSGSAPGRIDNLKPLTSVSTTGWRYLPQPVAGRLQTLDGSRNECPNCRKPGASERAIFAGTRRDSAVRRLIGVLPSAPVLTVATAAELTGHSFQAANQAIDRLVGAGVLVQVNVGRRNRAFEAPELIDVFTVLERQLASLAGDTLVSGPVRRVPERRL